MDKKIKILFVCHGRSNDFESVLEFIRLREANLG